MKDHFVDASKLNAIKIFAGAEHQQERKHPY
jgi:hypothetical protein